MAGNSSYGANLLRQFGQGLTFGTSDELEALFRSGVLGEGQYRQLKAQLERQREQWAEQNKKAATAAEIGGALVPGLVGAFVPGGQGATVGTGARIARAARAFDAPLEATLRRVAPSALNVFSRSKPGRFAVSVGDELLNGMMYSVGQAPTLADVPGQVADDAWENLAVSLGIRGATGAAGKTGRFAVDKYKNKRK